MVSSAEILKPGSVESTDVYVCNKGVDNVTSEPVTHQGGVEMAEAYDLVMSQVGMDDQSSPTELVDSTEAITKYREVESVQSQITDVQGHLKENLVYWKEVLHAPLPILDCIENGYLLPLKFIPQTYVLSG